MIREFGNASRKVGTTFFIAGAVLGLPFALINDDGFDVDEAGFAIAVCAVIGAAIGVLRDIDLNRVSTHAAAGGAVGTALSLVWLLVGGELGGVAVERVIAALFIGLLLLLAGAVLGTKPDPDAAPATRGSVGAVLAEVENVADSITFIEADLAQVSQEIRAIRATTGTPQASASVQPAHVATAVAVAFLAGLAVRR